MSQVAAYYRQPAAGLGGGTPVYVWRESPGDGMSIEFANPLKSEGRTPKRRHLLQCSQPTVDRAGPNNRLTTFGTHPGHNDSASPYVEMLDCDNLCCRRPRSHRRDIFNIEPNGSRVSPQNFVGNQRTLHEAPSTDYDDRYFMETSEPELGIHPLYCPEYRLGNSLWVSHFARFLSPSPLDSGLSSQSVASSPSLEAEPVLFRDEAFRNDENQRCLCPKVTYHESRDRPYPLKRCDYGRISPDARFLLFPPRITSSKILKSCKDMSYNEEDFDNNDDRFSQKRYGRLGIVGEARNKEPINDYEKCLQEQRYSHNNLEKRISCINTEENGNPHLYECQPHTSRACFFFVESPAESDGTPSPDRSNKSPGLESPASATASNSKSSSNNELDIIDRRKTYNTTEREIRELESMYKKCNINDRDLLDRAERRDLLTSYQGRVGHRLRRSNSDTLYGVTSPYFTDPIERRLRAPPLRRPCLSDDMALRKFHKPVSNHSSNPTDNTVTYMLCSAHFTPSVPVGKDVPDPELDDFSYRKHYLGKSNKIQDPQPPFGVPLRPLPPQKVFSDYLHKTPPDAFPPLYRARSPDVVRDDLAFRALRKEGANSRR